MRYNIMTIADLHWGVMDEEEMWNQFEFILEFIRKMDVDLIVIAGDYFDLKLYLNSKRAIKALEWFDTLFKLAKARGVQKIRMFRGTISHDADQMEVFRKYQEEDGFFKVYESCTAEETLPELQCIYCPDELMNTKTYLMTYTNELLSGNHIGFFHGSFDVVLRKDIDVSEMLYDTTSESVKEVITSITFPMNFFQKIIKYCWVGGHWHDGNQYENIYYVGSPTQWIHGEDAPKGFGFIAVDTGKDTYLYRKILNPIAPAYDSYEVHPDELDEEVFVGEMEYLINKIDTNIKQYISAGIRYNIRIVVYEPEKNVQSQNTIKTLKDKYVDNHNVVIRVKSKDKSKKRKAAEQSIENKKDFSFIKDKNMPVAKQIYEFIKLKTGDEVPLDYIEKMVQKFNT